jgi:hypothetical protein
MSGQQYASEQYMRFDPEIPEASRHQYDDVSDDYDRRVRVASEARADKLDDLIDRGRSQIRDVLGADNWLALRRRMRDENVSFRNLLQPPAEPTANYDKLSAARKENVQKYLDGLNVDTGKLRAIYRDVSAGVQELLPVTDVPSGHATWLNSEDIDEVRTTQTLSDTRSSAWQAFRPPFTGWQQGFNHWTSSGFRVSRVHNRNESTGFVGQDLRLDNNDASDFDNGWGEVDTQIAFWYRPPITGLVEVIVEARCGRGLHEVRISDEWGTSDSSTSQENLLMMHVLHPNVAGASFGWMSRFSVRTDNSGFFQREYLTPGGVYSARLFSDGPIPANQPVVIRAGTRSKDGSITNDMEINSLSVFRWSVQAVYVRVAA